MDAHSSSATSTSASSATSHHKPRFVTVKFKFSHGVHALPVIRVAVQPTLVKLRQAVFAQIRTPQYLEELRQSNWGQDEYYINLLCSRAQSAPLVGARTNVSAQA